jgi:hypothetical protein
MRNAYDYCWGQGKAKTWQGIRSIKRTHSLEAVAFQRTRGDEGMGITLGSLKYIINLFLFPAMLAIMSCILGSLIYVS